MPVDTDSELWNSTPDEQSSRTEILNFLKSNPGQAFTPEEISREVLNSDFEIGTSEEDLSPGETLGRTIGSAQHSAHIESFVKSHLSALVYEGEVQARVIPTDVDGEEIEIGHYTIHD